MTGPVCVLFALRREGRYFRRHATGRSEDPVAAFVRMRGASPRVRTNAATLVVETGIGAVAVERSLGHLLPAHQPSLAVFAGFAGALDESLSVGDVVVADEVVDVEGNVWPATWPPRGRRRGIRLLTSPALVASPEEKRRLAGATGAHVVDMESATFARRCTEAGVPFACVRAVSDDARTGLSPALASLLSGGRVSPLKLTFAVLRRPSLVVELARLARATDLAARQLAGVLECFPRPTPVPAGTVPRP